MFTKNFISKLRKVNVSKDLVTTRERVSDAWSKAKKEEQREVIALADVSINTIYRIRNTGIISARLTLALAQALNINPYYIIAANDTNDGFSEDAAKNFLIAHGYNSALKEFERASKKANEKAASDAASSENVEAQEVKEEKPAGTAAAIGAIQKLSEEDMQTLFRGLIIKAQTGKRDAVDAMAQIIDILLSH